MKKEDAIWGVIMCALLAGIVYLFMDGFMNYIGM